MRAWMTAAVVAMSLIVSVAAPVAADSSPPVVTAPLPYITWPQTVYSPGGGTYEINVQWRWTASDPDGIASQDIYEGFNYGSLNRDRSLGPDVRAYNFPFNFAVTTQFGVSATDTQANTSPVVAGSHWRIHDAGETIVGHNWHVKQTSNAIGGSELVLDGHIGDVLQLRFRGGRFALIVSTGPDGGMADFNLDNGLKIGTIDFYSPAPHFRQVILAFNSLAHVGPGANGEHLLSISWRSTSDPNGGSRITYDAGVSIDYGP